MYWYSYPSFAPAPLFDRFSLYVCLGSLGQLSRNRSLGGDIIKSRLTQLDCTQCYRPLARVVIHLFTLNVLP